MVILPGFGNNSADYLSPPGDGDAALAAALERRGFRAHVLALERRDWFRVGRMLLSRAYWRSSCTTAEGYQWYLDRVEAAVAAARAESGAARVVLVGHSAGGWLGRAYLGQHLESLGGSDSGGGAVAALVSLGTPHTPPPAGSGAKDMTGGALTWLDARWPGAHFAGRGVRYIAVAGRAVQGDRGASSRTLPGYSHSAYSQVCGEGHGVEGDAVVPLGSALLAGAEHVVIDGVLHSMSRVGTFEEPSGERWYGSDDVVDLWLRQLVGGQRG
jgi:pimeloyl-ACP methyl ester carboxylesterase